MKRNFDNWLKAYIEHSRSSEAPAHMHFWSGVSTLAGALRRRVWIDELRFQWTPNFYVVLVGPPGVVTKSTTLRTGEKLLREIPGVRFGPASITWQALTDELAKSTMMVPDPRSEDFYPMSCLTCFISEMGTFLKPEDRTFIDAMTDLWDGQMTTWRHETRGTPGVDIVNPWVNIIGATTPSWLKDRVPESIIGGGLTSRMIFCYGDKKERYVAYPSLVSLPDDYLDKQSRLIEDLQHIADLFGQYELTPEARKWGTEWYEDLWKNTPKHLTDDRYLGYVARKQTHIHKLAIVLAAAARNELIITLEDLQAAERFITATENDLAKVIASIVQVDSANMIDQIVQMINTQGQMTHRQLWTICMGRMDLKTFSESIKGAVQAGLLTQSQVGANIVFHPGKVAA